MNEYMYKSDLIKTLTDLVTENKLQEIEIDKNLQENKELIANSKVATKEDLKVIDSQLADIEQQKANVEEVRKKTVPISEYDISDGLKLQITGSAPINNVIGDKIITSEKTTFIDSYNIFNKDIAIMDKYINSLNGNLSNNTIYFTTDYIFVKQGDVIKTNALFRFYCWFDASKVYNSGGSGTLSQITSPITGFLRFSDYKSKISTVVVVRNDDDAIIIKPYKPILDNNYLELTKNDISDISTLDINIEQCTFSESINLANVDKFIDNFYVNMTYGNLASNSTYSATEHIEVVEGEIYSVSYAHEKAFYKEDGTFLSGNNIKTFTVPVGAKTIRCTVLQSDKQNFMIVKGSLVPTEFTPYGYKIKKSYLPNQDVVRDELLVYLPPKIYVAVDITIELYNKQVAWCGNIDNYHFRWHCSVGKNMKRKFSITGQSDKIGEYPLKLYIYDNNMKQVAYSETIIKIVSNVIPSSKSILTIGDSLSNDKPWYNEVINLSNSKLSYVGTKGKQSGYKHEGRSGFSADSYLKATPYTFNDNEVVHKFWDGTRFNYNYYKTQNNINPNIVQIFLGTNGISVDPTFNANNIKQIIDYIRQDDSTIPIYVINTLYSGNQDGIGVQRGSDGYSSGLIGKWKLEEDRKVFNLMVKLNELIKNMPNVNIIPISLTHDSEYNFGAVETPVNPRAVQKEYLPSEAVHCQLQGYNQFADCILSTICGTID